MAKGDYLGEFEYIIMLSLIRLTDCTSPGRRGGLQARTNSLEA